MQSIQAATGLLSVSAMGRTLIHEHIHAGFAGWQFDIKAPKYVRHELMSRSVDQLQELQAFGCKTLVDPCPMDIGRDVEFVAEVSQRSGTNIVVATGVYTEQYGIPALFRDMAREDILELYVKEITEGVGDTGIKTGVIKTAGGDDPANPYESKMMKIAAVASRLTGVPIIAHTQKATHGHAHLDIFEGQGVSASCICVAHCDERDDPKYQRSIAERGAYVGLDHFGVETLISDDARIRNIMQLVGQGHLDRILVSHDYGICLLGRLGIEFPSLQPNWNLKRFFEYAVPELRRLGMAASDIEHILVDNPRSFFVSAAAQANNRVAKSLTAYASYEGS